MKDDNAEQVAAETERAGELVSRAASMLKAQGEKMQTAAALIRTGSYPPEYARTLTYDISVASSEATTICHEAANIIHRAL